MSRRSFVPLNVVALSADPGSANAAGVDLYYNTTTSKFRYYTGSAWADLTSSGGSGGFTFNATAPSSPVAGDRWVDPDTGILYTYVNDGNTSQWVDFSASGIQAIGTDGTGNKTIYVGGTTPSAPANGDVWFDTTSDSPVAAEIAAIMGMY